MMEQLLHCFSEALDESEEVTGVLNLDGLGGLFDSGFGKYLCHKEFQFPANSGQFPANSGQFPANSGQFIADSLPIHCQFTADSLPIHCRFTADSLPIRPDATPTPDLYRSGQSGV
jgi:hypothetical protein